MSRKRMNKLVQKRKSNMLFKKEHTLQHRLNPQHALHSIHLFSCPQVFPFFSAFLSPKLWKKSFYLFIYLYIIVFPLFLSLAPAPSLISVYWLFRYSKQLASFAALLLIGFLILIYIYIYYVYVRSHINLVKRIHSTLTEFSQDHSGHPVTPLSDLVSVA